MSPRRGGEAPKIIDQSVLDISLRMGKVFDSLPGIPFLKASDLDEFEVFKRLFTKTLGDIDRTISKGFCVPGGLGQSPRYPADPYAPRVHSGREDGKGKKEARVGLFIGSFDPFQMTHLAAALRFLGNTRRPADLIYVVPEGAFERRKPGRSDYRYRFDTMSRQLLGIFDPLIQPLDIGEGADTIEIGRRLVARHKGIRLSMTHVLGSDVLPFAAPLIPIDLEEWGKTAKAHGVDFDYAMYVVRRESMVDIAAMAAPLRKMGVRVQIDGRCIDTPSSTDLRDKGAFTIVFPTPAMMEKVEVIFRYGMNQGWLNSKQGPEYEI